MVVRSAEPLEVDALAVLWHDAWHEAHASLVPAQLTALRTLQSFRDRLQAELASVRVIGPSGCPSGFCIVREAELYQLFVSATSRGSGVASALLVDAEQRLSSHGISTAWLACAIGNDRAAAFYEKHGWRRVGTMVNPADTSEGAFLIQVWRYEKRLV
jgi:ribosomal protein S18 acetylase RimI-like enzyme